MVLLLLLCGCGYDDGSVASEEASSKASLIPGIDLDTFMGITEEEPDAESLEEDIADSLALVMCEEYSPFESKLIWLHDISDNDDYGEERLKITTKLLSDGVIKENVLEDISFKDLVWPKLVIDLSDIDIPGEYILNISIESENGKETSFEEKLTIKSNKYSAEYDSFSSKDSLYEYIDKMLLNETEDEDFVEEIQSSYEKSIPGNDDYCMMAAILYRETGDSECRKVIEEYFKEITENYTRGEIIDFASRKPLYFGIITYLKTENPVNINTCETLMRIVLDYAISLTKRDKVEELSRLFTIDGDLAIEEANLNAHVLMLANSIGMSVDYVKSADIYLQYTGLDTDSAFVLYEMSKSETKINE